MRRDGSCKHRSSSSTADLIREFFRSESGKGHGYGKGFGTDCGNGSASFFRSSDHCDRDSDGYGAGWLWESGLGDDSGFGRGMGDSVGSGYAYRMGDGKGFGYPAGSYEPGAGKAKGIDTINGHEVYMINGTMVILEHVHSCYARGAILRDDLTLKPCWIAKEGTTYAFGKTLRKAQKELQKIENMPKVIRLAETKDLPFMPRRFR